MDVCTDLARLVAYLLTAAAQVAQLALAIRRWRRDRRD